MRFWPSIMLEGSLFMFDKCYVMFELNLLAAANILFELFKILLQKDR